MSGPAPSGPAPSGPAPSGPALAARLAPSPRGEPAGRARVADLLAALPPAERAAWDPLLAAHPAAGGLLARLAADSPFLWGLVAADPARALGLLAAPPEASLAAAVRAAEGAGREADAATAMRGLRRARQATALLVALADLGGAFDLDAVTGALSAFADAAVRAATRHALAEAHRAGRLALPHPDDPERASGLCVLALGKHGAGELNYSSDTDLSVFYDPATAPVPAGREAGPAMAGVVRAMTRLLAERTADGFVLRVDLRLRPDPGANPVAVSLPAALAYYESVGQNWERAALIKARPVAGDLAVGEGLLAALVPFVWRRYFDYRAIADVQSLKRQIRAHRGGAEAVGEGLALEGHDVKLGAGGIREVEFFAQTQQLVFGGRRPSLRAPRTLDALAALAQEGWITPRARDDLGAAYRRLRAVEHRLQMVADEQTQRLPREPAALDALARLSGEAPSAFRRDLLARMRAVERHDRRLYAGAPGLDAGTGRLVFAGGEDDPATLEALERLGFPRPSVVTEAVRGWHHGRRPAVAGARAREELTELVPALLRAFADSGDPEGALLGFDALLGRLPAAGELFALLRANAGLRDLLAAVLGGAPRLAAMVAARPHVLDAVIDPAFARPGAAGGPAARIAPRLRAAASHEEALDLARDLAAAERFLVGARLLSGVLDPLEAGPAYAAVAEAVTAPLLERCAAELAARHGPAPGGVALLALGRLGSREMTHGSDLDLVLLYAPSRAASEGARPLEAPAWFARLAQRLVTALTAPTRRGLLYDVDLRLRPSGTKGPVAVSLGALEAYYAAGGEAETWERMALTRARVIAGDEGTTARAREALAAALAAPRDPAATRREAAAMRGLLAREKPPRGFWDLKAVPGGLVDAEFAAQALRLAAGPRDPPPPAPPDTGAALAALADAGALARADADALIAAWRAQAALLPLLALWEGGSEAFDAARAGPALRARLAAAAGLPDLPALEAALAELRAGARAAFERAVGPVG